MFENYFDDKIVWITGASSGIGKELVIQLLNTKAIIIASSRELSSLQDLKVNHSNQLELITVDVTNPDSVHACMHTISKKYKQIDIAILNAGNCTYIDIENFSVKTIRNNFEVNFFGLANCVEACMSLLKKSSDPQLVGMSSAAAFLGLPRAEGYGAAKAATKYMLEALQSHLKRENISVSIIYPGFVKTPLTDRNDFPMPFLVRVDQAARLILHGIYKHKLAISFPRRLIWLLKVLAILPSKLRIYILAQTVSKI